MLGKTQAPSSQLILLVKISGRNLDQNLLILGNNNFPQNNYNYSKFNLYKKTNFKFRMEEYLLRIENRKIRQSITKFRMSGRKFPIKSDRYQKLPKELRICDNLRREN